MEEELVCFYFQHAKLLNVTLTRLQNFSTLELMKPLKESKPKDSLKALKC